MSIALEERLAATLARLILDPSAPPARHIAVGAASPRSAAACWLVKLMGHPVKLSLLHKRSGNPFTEGTRELFDLTGQGRIDLFFLGGGQIGGNGDLNLIGTGEWPGRGVRFPGSFGSAYHYFVVPRVILFTLEHTSRVLCEKVDFVSAPGTSPPEVYRPGGPHALITPKCVFAFDRANGKFRLASTHAGNSVEDVRENTGFAFETVGDVPQTPMPDAASLRILRTDVAQAIAETYPAFSRRTWGVG